VGRGYLTPDEIPASLTRRWICFPNDPYILAAINGALLELTFPYNWELFGSITPDEIVEELLPRVLDFQATLGLCMPIVQKPIRLSDEKAQNTNAGTFTSGAWRTRTLNTKQGDDDNIITLASNQFTIPAGDWYIRWRAPVNAVNRHQTLLYDITNSVGLAFGSSSFASGSGDFSFGEITLTDTNEMVCELQHRCQTTVSSTGFGVAGNFGTEIYAVVEIFPLF
jgi:hypothetical protein